MNIDGWNSVVLCPTCTGVQTCFLQPGGGAVWCTRDQKLSPVSGRTGKPVYENMYERYRTACHEGLRDKVAAELRVDATTLSSFGLGYCSSTDTFTIPFRDLKTWKMKGFYVHKVDGIKTILEPKKNDHLSAVFGPIDDPFVEKRGWPLLVVLPSGLVSSVAAAELGYTSIGRVGPMFNLLDDEFREANVIIGINGVASIIDLMKRRPIDLVIIPDRDGGWRDKTKTVYHPGDRVWINGHWETHGGKSVEIQEPYLTGIETAINLAHCLMEEMPKEAEGLPFDPVAESAAIGACKLRFMKLPPDVDNLHQFIRQHGEDAVAEAVAEAKVVTPDLIRMMRAKMAELKKMRMKQ